MCDIRIFLCYLPGQCKIKEILLGHFLTSKYLLDVTNYVAGKGAVVI